MEKVNEEEDIGPVTPVTPVKLDISAVELARPSDAAVPKTDGENGPCTPAEHPAVSEVGISVEIGPERGGIKESKDQDSSDERGQDGLNQSAVSTLGINLAKVEERQLVGIMLAVDKLSETPAEEQHALAAQTTENLEIDTIFAVRETRSCEELPVMKEPQVESCVATVGQPPQTEISPPGYIFGSHCIPGNIFETVTWPGCLKVSGQPVSPSSATESAKMVESCLVENTNHSLERPEHHADDCGACKANSPDEEPTTGAAVCEGYESNSPDEESVHEASNCEDDKTDHSHTIEEEESVSEHNRRQDSFALDISEGSTVYDVPVLQNTPPFSPPACSDPQSPVLSVSLLIAEGSCSPSMRSPGCPSSHAVPLPSPPSSVKKKSALEQSPSQFLSRRPAELEYTGQTLVKQDADRSSSPATLTPSSQACLAGQPKACWAVPKKRILLRYLQAGRKPNIALSHI